MNYDEAHDFAVALAHKAGVIARGHFSHTIAYETKSDNSPVTIADNEINKLVIKLCRERYPDIDVLGEEESHQTGNSKLLWVCDPIDGTIPYSLGMPISTFCLALVDDGVPVVGVVYDFNNELLYSAIKGKGAWLNGEPLFVDTDSTLPMKLAFIEWYHAAPFDIRPAAKHLASNKYQTPNYSSSAISSIRVALRRVSAVIYSADKPWDGAASKVIVEELGGKFTDLAGNEQRYDQPLNGYIACVPEVFEEVMEACGQS